MKKTAISLLTLAAIGLSGAALANGQNPYSAGLAGGEPAAAAITPDFAYGASTLPSNKYKIHAGLVTQVTTLDSADGAISAQSRARMHGLALGVDLPVQKNGTIELRGIYAEGDSTTTWGGGAADFDTDRSMFKLSGAYKHKFTGWEDLVLGAGLTYQVDTYSASDSHGDYTGRMQGLWANAIVEREFRVSNNWTVTPRLQYNHLLKGYQSIGSYEARQGSGRGIELAVGVTREFSGYNVTLKPYYLVTRINAHNTLAEIKGKEFGMQLSVAF